MELEEKVALVTGAGAGIGCAVALRLAREGAVVVIADVDEEAGSSVVREIESEGRRVAFVLADVISEADVSKIIAFAEDELGSLDVLVNNAGGVTEPYFPESMPEHWGRAIDLNHRGVMLSIHFGVRIMKKRGGDCQRLIHGRYRFPTEQVPPVLLQPEEIAEAVVMFAKNESMAGRVMIWQEGAPWQIVPLHAPY